MSRSRFGGVVVTVLVVAALALPAAAKTPGGVTSWVGVWRTNMGVLFFDDVHQARAEFPDATGKRQRYWAASANWSYKGKTERITGTILGGKYDYRTFSGCWHPADPLVSCGYVEIQRTGFKIRSGYWKACHQYCVSHHPWRGEKAHGAWRVGFQFTQEGPPKGGSAIKERTQIGGAGAAFSRDDPGDNNGRTHPTADSRVFLVINGPGPGQRKLTITPRVAYYDLVGDELPRLELRGTVTASDDPRCPAREAVSVAIIDGKHRAADRIELEARDDKTCRLASRWTSLGRGNASVRISYPTETGDR